MNKISSILDKITPEIQADMETVWYAADLHHEHPKIVDICNRPIHIEHHILDELKARHSNDLKWKMSSDSEWKKLINPIHNEWLVKDVVNKWVKKKDTFFLLGDVSMAKRADAEKFIDRLNGNKFLIEGNHDKNIDTSTRFSQITKRKDYSYSKFGLNIHIVLDHFPLVTWNRKMHGAWQLYGHVHGRYSNPFVLAFDVGIDNPELLEITGGIHRPLNLYEIVKLMAKKEQFIEEERIKIEFGIY